MYGLDYENTTGLDFAYFGGQFNGNTVADGDVTLTDNATNYVVADLSTGVVSDSTSNTNFLDTTNYLALYVVTTVTGAITVVVDYRQAYASGGGGGAIARELQFACSDLVTAFGTGLVASMRAPRAMTVSGVRAALDVAQTGGSVIEIDIKENGTTILSTLLTFDNGEATTTTAGTPAVISDSAIADDAKITAHVTQVGDGSARGLSITLLYTG